MNYTSPTPMINPNHMMDASGIFLIIRLSFMIITCIAIAKINSNYPDSTQISTPIIEIPIAVSISIQTVDNEHIGTVL
jgi:hypothetical protein